MSEEKKLVPVEQKSVVFYEDELTAVRAKDGHVYVVLAHMCEALGIDAQGQARRIRRHKVLDNGLTWVDILSTQGDQSQRRRAQVLRVDLVPLWLSGIRANSVNEEIRPKLEKFQETAAAVLWEAFQEGRLTTDPDFDTLIQQASQDAVEAYQIAQAMVKLARNQIMLEAKLNSHDELLADYGRRLETIEADLHQEERYISESQATDISQAVRAIAFEISKTSGANEYGRCWGEFYRKFGVSKYRHLPISRFDEAMTWLNAWYKDLTGNPF
jgi:hypothetical protein